MPGHDHIECRSTQLRIVGVQDIALVGGEADTSTADRAIEGNTRDRQRGGGADHRGDVRIRGLAGREHGAEHLHFVAEALGKQRADRAVDEARSQRLLLRQATFTLEEAAGNLARGEGLLDVMNRQREEAPVFFGFLSPTTVTSTVVWSMVTSTAPVA